MFVYINVLKTELMTISKKLPVHGSLVEPTVEPTVEPQLNL